MVDDATRCLIRNRSATGGTPARLYREAHQWIFGDSGEQRGSGFSFADCCDALGLDAGKMRSGIRAMMTGERRKTSRLRLQTTRARNPIPVPQRRIR